MRAAFLLVAVVLAGCFESRFLTAPPIDSGVTYTLSHINDVPVAQLPTYEPGPWDYGGSFRLVGATVTLTRDRTYLTVWTYRFAGFDSKGTQVGTYTQNGNALQFSPAGVVSTPPSSGTLTETGLIWLRNGEVLTFFR